MDAVLERLQELETKVREAWKDLAQTRTERDTLRDGMQSLQQELRSRDHELATLRAERERDGQEMQRLRKEREEIRTRVEGLLGEVTRLEAKVDSAG